MTLDVLLHSPDDAMRQAWKTAHEYMMWGKDQIDEMFGSGYAAKHPELLGAFMRTAAQDFHTVDMKAGLQDLRDVLQDIRDAMERANDPTS